MLPELLRYSVLVLLYYIISETNVQNRVHYKGLLRGAQLQRQLGLHTNDSCDVAIILHYSCIM